MKFLLRFSISSLLIATLFICNSTLNCQKIESADEVKQTDATDIHVENAPVKDHTLTLVEGVPSLAAYSAGEAGTTAPLERMYPLAPPVIPHAITDMVISRTQNECVDCHGSGEVIDEGHVATRVPPSHYVNEYTVEITTDRISGMRLSCLLCHVPQTDAPVPVYK